MLKLDFTKLVLLPDGVTWLVQCLHVKFADLFLTHLAADRVSAHGICSAWSTSSPHYQTMVFKAQIQGCKFILYWWILPKGLVCKPREVLKVSPLEKSEERLKNGIGNSFLINSYLNIKCCTVLNTINTKYTKLFTCWKYLNSGKIIQKFFIVRKSSVSC